MDDRIHRAWAASALASFGTDAAGAAPVLTELIEQSVRDQNGRPTFALAKALAKIAPDTASARQAVAALLGSLESKNVNDRIDALQTLELFGPSAAAAIPRIRPLKNDGVYLIRELAAKALRDRG